MPSTTQKTFSPKASEITHAWRLVDAQGQTLGRLATQIAGWLRGKHVPSFAEHMDLGDFVVVINARGIRVTGNKANDKIYYRHTGYPGGIYATKFKDMQAKHPGRALELGPLTAGRPRRGCGSAVLLGVANAIVRPALVLLTLPLTIVSLGLFLFVVNGATVCLVGWLLPGMKVDSFGDAMLAALVIWIVSWAGEMLLGVGTRQTEAGA